MPRCPVCGARIDKEGICSVSCKRERLKLKRIQAERRARYKKWDQSRPIWCSVCGKRLRKPGRFCHKHRKYYLREWRRRIKDVRTTASTK
jgi:predicted nucleic acid-binding Zn ribbon protein